MTNTFDFLDYNFSGLISIFAALIGMAYPLILQSIQRVNEMYHSTWLSGYVQKQKPIKRFNAILIIAIVFAILNPFLLREFNDNEVVCVVLALSHSLVTLLLLIATVSLYHFLQLTTRPFDLLKYIEDNPINGKPEGAVIYISQIAKFASDENDKQLYIESSSSVYRVFRDFRRNGLTFESYPKQAQDTLWMLTQYYAERPIGLMANSSLLCSTHFEIDQYIPFSDGDFVYIWRTLDTVLQTGSESFISGYWSFADQHYRFVLKNHLVEHREDIEIKAFHDRYLEFHTMLGALLVFNKRYSLLKTLMYFSNEEPPYYSLVPGSFDRIKTSLISLCKKTEYPFALAHSYLMDGMTSDVKCDNDILATAYRYHAILMIRLFTINDYFVFSKSKDVPSVTAANIEDIEREVQIMNRLKSYVSDYYTTDFLKESLLFVPDQSDVMALIDQYIGACNNKITDIKKTHNIDPNKVEYIKENMIQTAQQPLHIPSEADASGDFSKYNSVYLPVYWHFPISTDIVESGTYTNASNLPELIVQTLNNQIYKIYNSLFIRINAVAEFTIDFKDVKKALNQMQIDDSYAVISLGVYFGTFDEIYSKGVDLFEWDGDDMSYHGVRFYNVPSASNSLIVIKKDDLPYVTIADNDDDSVSEVGEGLGLFSNISMIGKETIDENQVELRTRRCVSFHYVKDMKYVRLIIKHYSDKELDLNKIDGSILT